MAPDGATGPAQDPSDAARARLGAASPGGPAAWLPGATNNVASSDPRTCVFPCAPVACTAAPFRFSGIFRVHSHCPIGYFTHRGNYYRHFHPIHVCVLAVYAYVAGLLCTVRTSATRFGANSRGADTLVACNSGHCRRDHSFPS